MNFAGVQSLTIPEGDVKSIAIGGVTVWERPNPLPYDAEVEYLESTGTQYIDTGVCPSNTTGFYVRVMRLESINANNTPIGVTRRVDGTAYRFGCLLQDFCLGMFGSVVSSNVSVSDGSWFDVSVNIYGDRCVKINGSTITSSISTIQSIPATAIAFAYRTNSGVSYNLKGRISRLDITEGSTLVRSFVPVRVGTVGYLFDRVSGTLFGNAGTGDFVLGPDKNGG